MRNVSTRETLILIQQLADQQVGSLETRDRSDLPELSNGGNAELEQCIDTLKSISREASNGASKIARVIPKRAPTENHVG